MNNYVKINAETIDRWVESGWEWGVPFSSEVIAQAKAGRWDVLLTPTRPVPHAWFAPALRGDRLDGADILGLASGGGQQMPLFAALGARVTVLDNSERQLENDRMVAKRDGLSLTAISGDMTKPFPFADESFDLIFHPVSNCYVEDVLCVWRECFRVLRPGGALLAGMDNGINFLFDDEADPPVVKNKLPFNPLRDPALMEKLLKDDDGVQFSHSLEEQVGGQLKAGLLLTDLYEDYNNYGILRDYCPQFIATRSIKP